MSENQQNEYNSRTVPAEDDVRILRERARQLTRYRQREAVQPAGRDVLDFVVGGDAYALPVSTLREIRPLPKLTPIPGTPDFVRGILPIRGQLVSVLDLRVLLGLSPTAVTGENCALVLENEKMTFSFLVDQVGQVHFLPDKDLEAGEASLERLDRRYIIGVTGERMVLLDGEKILSDPTLVVNG